MRGKSRENGLAACEALSVWDRGEERCAANKTVPVAGGKNALLMC
jgi:hypothetical protein